MNKKRVFPIKLDSKFTIIFPWFQIFSDGIHHVLQWTHCLCIVLSGVELVRKDRTPDFGLLDCRKLRDCGQGCWLSRRWNIILHFRRRLWPEIVQNRIVVWQPDEKHSKEAADEKDDNDVDNTENTEIDFQLGVRFVKVFQFLLICAELNIGDTTRRSMHSSEEFSRTVFAGYRFPRPFTGNWELQSLPSHFGFDRW